MNKKKAFLISAACIINAAIIAVPIFSVLYLKNDKPEYEHRFRFVSTEKKEISLTPVWSTNGIIEYSYDYSTWYTANKWVTIKFSNILYMRGMMDTPSLFNSDEDGNAWNITGGEVECLGNINELLNYQNPPTEVNDFCFNGMFWKCRTLISAPELPALKVGRKAYDAMFLDCETLKNAPSELPATTLDEDCYNAMFAECFELEKAPRLPALNLADYCYDSMFECCYALKKAPELPAKNLTSCCYEFMFDECSSLKSFDILPATTLTECCYSTMFNECTSLTTAPKLPAQEIGDCSYEWMFNGCTSLNLLPEVGYLGVDSYSTDRWLENVAPTGTMYKAGEQYIETGISTIPDGWNQAKI